MKQTELRNVKHGDFFRLANSETAPVWVRGDYNRASKKFEAYKYNDGNYWNEFRGSRVVFVGCEF